MLDLDNAQFTDIYSVGFEDYSKIAVDINKKDEQYDPKAYTSLRGIRMPDGISLYETGGETYLLTANEGDARAWPVEEETDTNEIKNKQSPVNKIETGGKVTWFDVSQYDGLESDTDYIFCGRSFTLFQVTENGLKEVFDSDSDFERITDEKLADYFNCSNDDIEKEDRSGKNAPEPESVTVGTVGGKTYAFIALERIGGVMVYALAFTYNGTTYAPLRALAEAYGLEVGYDAANKIATVNAPETGITTAPAPSMDFASQWAVAEKPMSDYGSEKIFTAVYSGSIISGCSSNGIAQTTAFITVLSVFGSSIGLRWPSIFVRSPWGSTSIVRTFLPSMASPAAML